MREETEVYTIQLTFIRKRDTSRSQLINKIRKTLVPAMKQTFLSIFDADNVTVNYQLFVRDEE